MQSVKTGGEVASQQHFDMKSKLATGTLNQFETAQDSFVVGRKKVICLENVDIFYSEQEIVSV